MNKLMSMLALQLIRLLVPTLIKELVRFLEEVTEIDIDGDGNVGFYKLGQEKTVKETVDELTGNERSENAG